MNNIQRNGRGYSPIKLYLQKWEAGSQFIVFDPCPRGWQSHKMEGIWVPEWLPGEHYLPPMKALTLIQHSFKKVVTDDIKLNIYNLRHKLN